MRRLTVRLTFRRTMLLVVVAAVILCGVRWVQLSLEYRQRAKSFAYWGRWPGPGSEEGLALFSKQVTWAHDLARKYDRAARYPWLPVEPDSPMPK